MIAWVDDGTGNPQANGLVDVESARIGILDRGLIVGDGVFETLKVVAGQPFALTRHLRRLHDSARVMEIDLPTATDLQAAILATLAANASDIGEIGRLRLTVTHGRGVLGDPYAGDGPPLVVVTVVPQRPWPAVNIVELSTWTRNEHSALTGVKSTSYAENAIALRAARRQGAHEALLLNTAGEVCEGTGSNIVVALDGQLVTPPLASGCLAGITRELALQWCAIAERTVTGAELAHVTEAFLTSSTRDLHPISRLAGRDLPAAGPLTRQAIALWRTHAAQGIDP